MAKILEIGMGNKKIHVRFNKTVQKNGEVLAEMIEAKNPLNLLLSIGKRNYYSAASAFNKSKLETDNNKKEFCEAVKAIITECRKKHLECTLILGEEDKLALGL